MNRNRRYNKNLIKKQEPEDSGKEQIKDKMFNDEDITNPDFVDKSVKSTLDSSRVNYIHMPKIPNEAKEEVKEVWINVWRKYQYC